MRPVPKFAAVVLLVLLAACDVPAPDTASVDTMARQASAPAPLQLGNGVRAILPAWQAGPGLNLLQVMNARYGPDRQVSLQIRVGDGRDGLKMTGLDGFGRRVFDINWSLAGIQASRADWVPEELRPEDVLLHYLLANRAPDVVKDMVRSGTLRSGSGKRELLDETGRPVLTVTYQGAPAGGGAKTVKIRNMVQGYEMTIRSHGMENQ